MVRGNAEQRMFRALGLLEQLNIQFCRMHGGPFILQVPQTLFVFCNLALAIMHMRLSPIQAISMGSVSATFPECRMYYTPQTNRNYLITKCYIILHEDPGKGSHSGSFKAGETIGHTLAPFTYSNCTVRVFSCCS